MFLLVIMLVQSAETYIDNFARVTGGTMPFKKLTKTIMRSGLLHYSFNSLTSSNTFQPRPMARVGLVQLLILIFLRVDKNTGCWVDMAVVSIP
jgi:hypothetical protein